MIISISELRELLPEYKSISDKTLEYKLKSIESLIRSYTKNSFQCPTYRFEVSSDTALIGTNEYFNTGDTVQISESINNGLYEIVSIENGRTVLNGELLPSKHNLITKIKYPSDIVMGAVNMLKWDMDNRDKVGIQSETISRHSVTYFNMDGDNSLAGYPKLLTGFLKPYMKARF